MSNNLGRSVRWIDNEGGHHTGRVVTLPSSKQEVKYSNYRPEHTPHLTDMTLVRESCNLYLTWVPSESLQPYPNKTFHVLQA